MAHLGVQIEELWCIRGEIDPDDAAARAVVVPTRLRQTFVQGESVWSGSP